MLREGVQSLSDPWTPPGAPRRGNECGTSSSEQALARAHVYELFGAIFSLPASADLVRQVVKEQFLTRACRFHCDQDRHPEAAVLEEGEWPGCVEQIGAEYVSLFCASGAHFVAPYQSAYSDAVESNGRRFAGLLCDTSFSALTRLYQRFGFQVPEHFHEMPDHIAVGLSFMATLCREEARAETPKAAWLCRDAEVEFVRIGLGRWAFAFLDRVEANGVSGFYRKAAQALVRFLRGEFRAMALTPAEVGHPSRVAARL